jgi:hypothetical protein
MHIASIGIDLGKTTVHLVAWGERNKILVRKKFHGAIAGLYCKPAGRADVSILGSCSTKWRRVRGPSPELRRL